MKVFLDSSVIIAALISVNGGSAKIIALCEAGLLKGFISQDVLAEVDTVLTKKLPELKPYFKKLISSAKLRVIIIKSRTKKVAKAKTWISDPDDACILAAAKEAGVDYLITLDIKDFIRDTRVSKKSGLAILTPGDFLQKIMP